MSQFMQKFNKPNYNIFITDYIYTVQRYIIKSRILEVMYCMADLQSWASRHFRRQRAMKKWDLSA